MIYIQILIERKSVDPVAVTAEETLRTRFGLQDVLAGVQRRRLAELAMEGESLEPLRKRIEQYLEDTFSFWNSNRERAWIRGSHYDVDPSTHLAPVAEIGRGEAPRLGTSDLAAEGNTGDHLIVWTRDEDSFPGDLRPVVNETTSRAVFREAQCYSLEWRDQPSAGVREERTTALAAVRSRHEGFFVHPHFQEHRTVHGRLPLPVWNRASDLAAETSVS